MKYKLTEIKNKISGIYKITFPNGKSYIGLSNDIKKRIYSHNEYDYKRKRLIGNAIQKYGPIKEVQILEEIPSDNRELMSEREKYWIKYYHTCVYDQACNGYNASWGGEGATSLFGLSNPNSAFDEETLAYVFDVLKNKKHQSMTSLAAELNVNRNTIHQINVGNRYKIDGIQYPIRDKKQGNTILLSGNKANGAKLSQQQINQIYDELKYSTKTMSQIAKEYKCDPTTIGNINKGIRYHRDNINYPLRDKQTIKKIQYTKL